MVGFTPLILLLAYYKKDTDKDVDTTKSFTLTRQTEVK